jgi:hypothetical protein
MVLYDQTILRGGDLLIGAREKFCHDEAPPSVPRGHQATAPSKSDRAYLQGARPFPSQYNDWAGILKPESVMLSLKARCAISTKDLVWGGDRRKA